MDNIKNDEYYIGKIKGDLLHIIKNTEGLSEYEIGDNDILVDSIMFRLIQISENCDKLTDELKNKNSHIPWRALKGLRNRIVHDYGAVDLFIIYDTVMRDIPQLLNELNTLEW
jgi:uncharacterized protein with HEPN domain